MPEKILIIEDESALQETLAYNLQKQGYEVVIAGTGPKGLELARTTNPELILLDIMLPGMDGFEVCRLLRQEMSTPVLMLTARDDEIDRVVGLEVGADDYMVKPFSMRELIARVKAMLRRVRLIRQEFSETATIDTEQSETLIFGNLEIDISRREIKVNKVVQPIKPQEFDLLLYFARHRGKVLSRENILEKVWGWEFTGDSRTVDVHVRWLREKIEPDPANPTRIVTVRGSGYLFEG